MTIPAISEEGGVMSAFEIVTFASQSQGSVARIKVAMKTKKGKTVMDWLPVAIHAPTCAEVRERADKFYRDEQARLSQSDEARAARIQKAREARHQRSAA